ncbi:MAG TPA: hypothetical protein PL033_17700 [Candidatus Brocadiia bacterium]|nr:hypothetical protein [Candidatus Brocadiia bacterium]
MKCPECDVEFPGGRGDKCPRCGWQDLSVEPERKGLPWEERKELGFFTGFFQTIFIVLFSPRKAFELLRAGEIRRDPPKFFFYICGYGCSGQGKHIL